DGGHAQRDAAHKPKRDATVADADTHDGANAGHHEGADTGRQDGADAGKEDGSSRIVLDSSTNDAADALTGEAPLVRIPGWSVRKRIRAPGGGDLALEQVLASFLVADPGRSRIEHIGVSGASDRSFDAPTDAFLTDFCVHPSGEISALLTVGSER